MARQAFVGERCAVNATVDIFDGSVIVNEQRGAESAVLHRDSAARRIRVVCRVFL